MKWLLIAHTHATAVISDVVFPSWISFIKKLYIYKISSTLARCVRGIREMKISSSWVRANDKRKNTTQEERRKIENCFIISNPLHAVAATCMCFEHTQPRQKCSERFQGFLKYEKNLRVLFEYVFLLFFFSSHRLDCSSRCAHSAAAIQQSEIPHQYRTALSSRRMIVVSSFLFSQFSFLTLSDQSDG